MPYSSLSLRPWVLLLGGALTGCLPYGAQPEPEPPMEVPPSYQTGDGQRPDPGAEEPSAGGPAQASATEPQAEPARPTGPQKASGRWWTAFPDPGLAKLERRALDRNLDLRIAWSRIEQSRALATQANAARWPQVNLEGRLARSSSQNIALPGTTDAVTANVSAPVSYEVDLFARRKAEGRAAELQAQATRANYEAMAMSVSASVAERWYDLVQTRARRALIQEQLDLNETFLELVQLRFEQGLTSALDVHQQRRQVVATRSQLSLVDAREATLSHQLAVLTGENPGNTGFIPQRAQLPNLPETPDQGVPADLLDNRPDVRAARHRVAAADQRVGAAIAARLPTLRVSATPGYDFLRVTGENPMGGGSQTRKSKGFVWSVGAQVTVPLFDGFRRRAEVNLREAEVREAVQSYTQTLRQAMTEVHNALSQEREQREHIEQLEKQVEVSDDTLQAARDRYRQGLTDFLPVLTALQAKQQAELELLAARRQLLSFRIQLHRALGGTWTQELEEPVEES